MVGPGQLKEPLAGSPRPGMRDWSSCLRTCSWRPCSSGRAMSATASSARAHVKTRAGASRGTRWMAFYAIARSRRRAAAGMECQRSGAEAIEMLGEGSQIERGSRWGTGCPWGTAIAVTAQCSEQQGVATDAGRSREVCNMARLRQTPAKKKGRPCGRAAHDWRRWDRGRAWAWQRERSVSAFQWGCRCPVQPRVYH